MRGQGAIEYLLIFIAVLGLIGGVLLVLNSTLSEPASQRDVQLDVIECSNNHVWLKEYFEAYEGELSTAPGSISYYQTGLMQRQPNTVLSSEVIGDTACVLQDKYKLNISATPTGKTAWLETDNANNWIKYGGSTGGGTGGPTELALLTASSTSALECGSGTNAIDFIMNTVELEFEKPGAAYTGKSGNLELHFVGITGTVKIGLDTVTNGQFSKTITVGDGSNSIIITIDGTQQSGGYGKVCGNNADADKIPKITLS